MLTQNLRILNWFERVRILFIFHLYLNKLKLRLG